MKWQQLRVKPRWKQIWNITAEGEGRCLEERGSSWASPWAPLFRSLCICWSAVPKSAAHALILLQLQLNDFSKLDMICLVFSMSACPYFNVKRIYTLLFWNGINIVLHFHCSADFHVDRRQIDGNNSWGILWAPGKGSLIVSFSMEGAAFIHLLWDGGKTDTWFL